MSTFIKLESQVNKIIKELPIKALRDDERFDETNTKVKKLEEGLNERIDKIISENFTLPEIPIFQEVRCRTFKDYLLNNFRELAKRHNNLKDKIESDFTKVYDFELYKGEQASLIKNAKDMLKFTEEENKKQVNMMN